MLVYLYDSNTKIFIIEYICQKNPKRPNEFLIPKYSTNIKPLENKIGYYTIFNEKNNIWEYQENEQTKKERLIQEEKERLEKNKTIEQLKEDKKQELKQKRDEYKKTILIKEYVYLSDLEVATNNYENMKNCVYGWVEQDYLKYREEMNKIVNKYNEIKQLISQANTKEELDNIKIVF